MPSHAAPIAIQSTSGRIASIKTFD